MNTSPSHAAPHAVAAPHSTILKILQSGKSGFRQLICIALALLFAQAANAETAAELKTTIEGYTGGTGNLSAEVSGNTVTVTGTKTDVTDYYFGISLNIDAGITVIWKAELSGTSPYSYLLAINGAGLLEVQNGGTVSATGNGGTSIINSGNSTVNITGGTVSATTGTAVNNQGTAVNISGGTVSATTGIAVYINSNNFVRVSGTAKITSANTEPAQGTIYLREQGTSTEKRLEIAGGTVENTAANGNAIYNGYTGGVVLGGNPTITGTIMKAYTGGLSVDGSFAPASDKTYTLGFTDISGVAVAGGASHISNFTLANNSVAGINFSLSASGNNLVFLVTNGYAVAKSGTTYTITRGAGEIASAQGAIDNIKTQANGTACTIQFGNGTDALDIGDGNTTLINFDGTANSWGLITLTGKLTTASTASYYIGIIHLSNGASIDSKAQLEATSYGNILYIGTGTATISGGYVKALGGGAAVYNASNGTVNISDGEVSATTGWIGAVYNYGSGTVNISGGTVSATTGPAVYNSSTGKITVSGTAKVTSARTTSDIYAGTICLASSGTATDELLAITGGTVENTASEGIAVNNNSTGAVNISGGVVQAKEGYAVYKEGTGATTITGGLLFAYGTSATDVIYGDYDATSGNAVIAAWDNTAGATTYAAITGGDIVKFPETATAVWENRYIESGILATNGANTNFVAIDGVNVRSIPVAVFPTIAAITYDPAKILANITLVGGSGAGTFKWEDATIVPTVSNNGYNVIFTPTDTDNYRTLRQNVALSVAKANPVYTVPTGLTATVGQTLADVSLAAFTGWAWESASTTPVGNAGTQPHKAKFTPSDTENYNTLTDISVSVEVKAAVPILAPQIAAGSIRVQATANAIVIENLPSNAKVDVYNLQGKRIYSAYPENPKILKIGVQTKGVYVVKAGSQTMRVAVK